MSKEPVVKSNYNIKEAFTFDQTPNEFKSVTEKSINDIKNYCAETISRKYNGSYDSRSLYPMVRQVAGKFDLLSSRLEDDYACRKSKLKSAQIIGVKQANELILQFEKMIADREMALKRYSDNVLDYDGYTLEDLQYSKERVQEFKKRLKLIEEKNHEA